MRLRHLVCCVLLCYVFILESHLGIRRHLERSSLGAGLYSVKGHVCDCPYYAKIKPAFMFSPGKGCPPSLKVLGRECINLCENPSLFKEEQMDTAASVPTKSKAREIWVGPGCH